MEVSNADRVVFPDDGITKGDVVSYYEREQFPSDLIPELAELGLLGASIQGYGCAGMTPRQYGLILQELEYGDSGLRSFVSVQGSLAMYAIYSAGTEEQKQRFLPRMAQGTAIGCFGLTEPDSGSDPGSAVAGCVEPRSVDSGSHGGSGRGTQVTRHASQPEAARKTAARRKGAPSARRSSGRSARAKTDEKSTGPIMCATPWRLESAPWRRPTWTRRAWVSWRPTERPPRSAIPSRSQRSRERSAGAGARTTEVFAPWGR